MEFFKEMGDEFDDFREKTPVLRVPKRNFYKEKTKFFGIL